MDFSKPRKSRDRIQIFEHLDFGHDFLDTYTLLLPTVRLLFIAGCRFGVVGTGAEDGIVGVGIR